MLNITLRDLFRSHGTLSIKFIKSIDHVFGAALTLVLPAQIQSTTFTLATKKILVIRPGGIGDAVFLLPILKSLKTQGFLIDVLCELRNAAIFSSQGYQVYHYNKFAQLSLAMRNSYDVVVDTEQWHFLSGVISYFSKSRIKIGFASRKHRHKLFTMAIPYAQNGYELDNFAKLFDRLIKSSDHSADLNRSFIVNESDKAWAKSLIPSTSISIFLGASIPLRRFSKEQLITLINNALSIEKTPVLLGGQDVVSIAIEVMDELKDARIMNFVGKTTLVQSAALIEQSQKFIGPDSGLMHLACALGTPVVAIFGPGQINKWQPKGQQHRIITKNVSCSPCTRFGYTMPTCHGSYHCMKDIDLKNICSK